MDARPEPRRGGALRILAHRPAALLALGVVAFGGLLTSPCLLGVPVLVGMLVSIASTCLDAGCAIHDLPIQRSPSRGNWVAALSIFAFLATTLLAGVASVEALEGLFPSDADALPRVVLVASATLVATCLSPLAFVPFAALDEGASFAPAAFRSAHVAAKRGMPRQMATALISTLVLFSPVLLDAALAPIRERATAVWALALAVSSILAFPSSFAILADAYLSADPRASEPTATGTTTSRRAGRVLLLAVVSLGALLVGTLTVAALVPLPATPHADVAWRPRRLADATTESGRPLPRTRISATSLSVRGTHDGIVVEADDGGGVGHVRTASIGTPSVLWILRTARRRDAPIHLVVAGPVARATEWVLVDAHGVRLDDGVAERWSRRVGTFGACLLATAGLLALLALWRVGGLLAAARHLDHPFSNPPPGRRAALTLAAVDGTLRLGKNATVWISPPSWAFGRARADVRGDAWLEAADGHLRVRLPPGHVWALSHLPEAAPMRDGERISVVGRFGAVASGTRDADIPWPRTASLVVGDHARAALGLTARAMQAWAAVAALLMLVLSTTVVWIVLSF
ncbi:MAG: hypothetical protein IT379_42620 [Deltaproteobacteria bacterium]|nr:hypothetical protein [Deltaproteobacteria bacterium]